MTDHEKEIRIRAARYYGEQAIIFEDSRVFKDIENRGYWVEAHIFLPTDELVRVQGQALQDAGSSVQSDEGELI